MDGAVDGIEFFLPVGKITAVPWFPVRYDHSST
jgi:hypothetical protein